MVAAHVLTATLLASSLWMLVVNVNAALCPIVIAKSADATDTPVGGVNGNIVVALVAPATIGASITCSNARAAEALAPTPT